MFIVFLQKVRCFSINCSMATAFVYLAVLLWKVCTRSCAERLVRKILALCGKPCLDKTVDKTFVRKKPCAGLVRLVGLLRKVLSEPCAAIF